MQTHNIALTKSIAQFVVTIRDGKVASQQTINDALRMDSYLLAEAITEAEVEKTGSDDPAGKDESKSEDGKLIADEEIGEGNVGLAACKSHVALDETVPHQGFSQALPPELW